VALYTSYLPAEERVSTYSGMLQVIADPHDIKELYSKLAKEFGLDYTVIAKKTVEDMLAAVREDLRNPPAPSASLFLDTDPSLSQDDKRRIDCLEWLALEASLHTKLLEDGNLLAKWFLGEFPVLAFS